MSETRQSSTVDLVDLWKRSDIPKTMSPDHNVAMSRTSIADRYSGERSMVWTNLSQMSPSDQALFMSKLTSQWPYDMERRALNWPMHIGLLTNCITSALISTRVNSDMVLLNPKMSFFKAVSQCPKAPFVFGVYSSGITFYVLQQMTVNMALFRETDPCSSCMLTRSVAIALFTGIVMPMMATPYLSYYVLMQRKNEKFPVVKNMLEFVMLSLEGGRAARPLLKGLIPLQVAVASMSLYASLWGRDRLFSTLDADPDMAKEMLINVQSKPSLKQRVQEYLRNIPLISDVLGHDSPENERY